MCVSTHTPGEDGGLCSCGNGSPAPAVKPLDKAQLACVSTSRRLAGREPSRREVSASAMGDREGDVGASASHGLWDQWAPTGGLLRNHPPPLS